MVRLKQSFPETVQLILSGPKSVLKETMTVDARLSHSWYELLYGELDLEVHPDSGIFVCTLNYTPTAPKTGQGWKCELNEQIREYISRFERKRRQYYVRLCHPDNILSRSSSLLKTPTKVERQGSPTRLSGVRNGAATPAPKRSGSPQRVPNIVIPTRGQHVAAIVPPTPTPHSSQAINGNHGQSHSHQNSSQQQVYGTRRQKRHHQQTLEETSLGATGQAKQVRFQNAEVTPTQQRQRRGGRRNNAREDGVPRIDNVSSIPELAAAAIKLELDVEEPDMEEEQEEANAGNLTWDQEGWDSVEGGGVANGNANHHSSDDDEFEDNSSLCTAATAEENELRREGIQVEDVKTLAEARMTRFSNAYMLRVRNEIRKLQKNHLWDRNVNRAPLACYLLQEIFKQ